jgi:hypothetical protein
MYVGVKCAALEFLSGLWEKDGLEAIQKTFFYVLVSIAFNKTVQKPRKCLAFVAVEEILVLMAPPAESTHSGPGEFAAHIMHYIHSRDSRNFHRLRKRKALDWASHRKFTHHLPNTTSG